MSYDSTSTLNLGVRTATAVQIGRSGVTTTFTSGSTVDFNGVTVLNFTLASLIVTGNITSTTGNIAATLGSLSAGTTVTAGTGITATTGNIVASTGNITATLGNIAATAGSLSAGTTVTAGTGVTATTGNITATTGNIVATAGNVLANSGIVSAGTGSQSAPGFTFSGFTDSGMYYNTTDGSVELTSAAVTRLITYHQKTLPNTSGTATAIISISGLSATIRGGIEVTWFLELSDGTSNQTAFGTVLFGCQETTGAVTASATSSDATAVGVGSLFTAWSVDVATAHTAKLLISPTFTALVPTTTRVELGVRNLNPTSTAAITFL